MMECVLLRHGIAVERDEWAGPDSDRPLTERGAKRVAQVAAGLNRLDVQPTHVLSSPLIRAIETAKIMHSSLRVRAASANRSMNSCRMRLPMSCCPS